MQGQLEVANGEVLSWIEEDKEPLGTCDGTMDGSGIESLSSTPSSSASDSNLARLAIDEVLALSLTNPGDRSTSFLLRNKQMGNDKIFFKAATSNHDFCNSSSSTSSPSPSSSSSSSSATVNLHPFLPFKHLQHF